MIRSIHAFVILRPRLCPSKLLRDSAISSDRMTFWQRLWASACSGGHSLQHDLRQDSMNENSLLEWIQRPCTQVPHPPGGSSAAATFGSDSSQQNFWPTGTWGVLPEIFPELRFASQPSWLNSLPACQKQQIMNFWGGHLSGRLRQPLENRRSRKLWPPAPTLSRHSRAVSPRINSQPRPLH